MNKGQGVRVRSWENRHQLPSITEGLLSALVLLAVALLSAWVFLFILGVVRVEGSAPLFVALQTLARGPRLPHGLGPVVSGAAAALIGMIAIGALFRRLGPSHRPSSRPHILAVDDTGMVIVDRKGIAAVAAAVAMRNSGVVDVAVDVAGSGSSPVGLRVLCWVHAGAPLSEIGTKVRDRVSQAVTELVGLEVQEVMVELIVVPLEELRRVVE